MNVQEEIKEEEEEKLMDEIIMEHDEKYSKAKSLRHGQGNPHLTSTEGNNEMI